MKLSNKETSSKAYWSILKRFVNDKKIPIISHYTTMVILLPIFAKKRNFLTPFLQKKCSILQKSSKFPTNLAPRTDHSLRSISLSQDDILKITQNGN